MINDIKKVFFKQDALPASLTFFVTNKCNLKCKHCFYWDNLNKKNNELTLEEIDRFTKTVGKLMVLNIGGGEPFVRADFAEVIKVLIKNTRPHKLIIVSNGSVTKKIIQDAHEILKNSGQTHITFHFSIDDIADRLDEFRGMNGLFEKIKITIAEMRKLKEHYSNFNIGVTMTVNPINQERVKDIYEHIRDYIRPDVVSPILMRSTSDKLDSKNVDVRYYENLFRQIKADTDSKRIQGHHNFALDTVARNVHHYKHVLIAETARTNQIKTPCYAAKLSGVIYEDGNIACCEILNEKIGNIRDFDYDFRKLWLSPKAQEMSKKIIKTKCFCTYECAMDINVAYNFKNFVKAAFQPSRR